MDAKIRHDLSWQDSHLDVLHMWEEPCFFSILFTPPTILHPLQLGISFNKITSSQFNLKNVNLLGWQSQVPLIMSHNRKEQKKTSGARRDERVRINTAWLRILFQERQDHFLYVVFGSWKCLLSRVSCLHVCLHAGSSYPIHRPAWSWRRQYEGRHWLEWSVPLEGPLPGSAGPNSHRPWALCMESEGWKWLGNFWHCSSHYWAHWGQWGRWGSWALWAVSSWARWGHGSPMPPSHAGDYWRFRWYATLRLVWTLSHTPNSSLPVFKWWASDRGVGSFTPQYERQINCSLFCLFKKSFSWMNEWVEARSHLKRRTWHSFLEADSSASFYHPDCARNESYSNLQQISHQGGVSVPPGPPWIFIFIEVLEHNTGLREGAAVHWM